MIVSSGRGEPEEGIVRLAAAFRLSSPVVLVEGVESPLR